MYIVIKLLQVFSFVTSIVYMFYK